MKTTAPYGSWKSLVTAEFVSGKDRGLSGDLQADGEQVYFLESRPDEGGRQALMCRTADGAVAEALPREFNVRTRYLEYGGSSFFVQGGQIYFVHFADQQIYRARVGEAPVRLTNDPASRFADFSLDAKRKRLLALREVTSQPESKNTVCAIDLASGAITDLVSGADFYLAPRLSDDGDELLWVSWNHPNMAWNGTELWVGDVSASGDVSHPRKIAGDASHAVCQPEWTGEREITFVAELGEWLNLYRWTARDGKLTPLYPAAAEFAYPAWVPGQSQYAVSGGVVGASFLERGESRFLLWRNGKAEVLPQKFGSVSGVSAGPRGFYFIATFTNRAAAIVHLGLDGSYAELYSASRVQLAPEEVSLPAALEVPLAEGGVAHAWVYEPTNSRFTAPAGERPPLLVLCHGGPTSMSAGEFRKSVQFWTSRGYSVADVNYGGSTGFGRTYRERLRGNWGKVDVSDAVAVVQHLARAGRIDPKRVAIRGGSAGGYTTLAGLTFTRGVIGVGASYYGVSDLALLAKETHKLESRYMDQLVGPYPETEAVYRERSPIEHVDQLNCPIIFFQGDEDKVVPPNQSEKMYRALLAKGIASEYHLYAGEGHGFRKAESNQHSLKAEHGFYAKFMGFAVDEADRV